jgi:hypothetical protein
MALCVLVDQSGNIVADPLLPPPEQCQAYLLVGSNEYQQIVAANNIFAVPTVQELQAAWMAGFVVPMIAGLTAWAVGSVVNMFKEK